MMSFRKLFYQCPRSYPDTDTGFAMEIEKHMITEFSRLEVHLITPEHVFGAFMLRLLGMHRVRTATRSLKIVLQRFKVIFDVLTFQKYVETKRLLVHS
jgi:hypothetical protein